MAKFRLNFYSARKNKDECIYFENRKDFEALKWILFKATYIKDLKAFVFDSKSKMYKEVSL